VTVYKRGRVRLLAVILNVAALVAPIYVWLAIAQTPIHDLHIPLILMGIVSLAPVTALLALIERPSKRISS
jgi:hypothetical protein